MTDTIFALATAPGRGAVAVIRLSGPASGPALRALSRQGPRPRRARLARLRDATGAVLDQALTLWFPAPQSYTGEDCVELHLHGGAAVIDGVTHALLALGLRLAKPGEFTRRAFEHGKLDLDQAEAVADLIDAESAGPARQAMAQLGGALGRRYAGWRGALVDILAQLEAAVDFPDEEIPEDISDRARSGLGQMLEDLDIALADADRGRRVRDGYRIAILGAPNAGKSSLINALTGLDTAIVTAIPGTTRDIIEAPMVLGGYRVIVADMAGLRETADAIEIEGVRRAKAWGQSAALRLWVVDRAAHDEGWREAAALVTADDLCLLNKGDLAMGNAGRMAAAFARVLGCETTTLSLKTGDVEDLRDRLARRVVADLAGTEFPAATRARHMEQLSAGRSHLNRALDSLAEPELAAEDVRLAARALERISGRVGAEDVLERVFASFCIGK